VNRRVAAGAVLVAAWLAGLAALVRREFFRGETERMAQAALLIAPGAEYYVVTSDSQRVGYASSTLDTSTTGIHLTEFLIAEAPATGGVRRLAARSLVNLTRGMKLVNFQFELGESYAPYRVFGSVDRDSTLVLVVTAGDAPPDTTMVALHGPLMLPTTLPLAVALEQRPRVGRRFTFSVYDPLTGTVDADTVRVKAESLFVLTDSASLDEGVARWAAAHQDTVRAWRLEQSGGSGILNGWVDEKGRLVQAAPLGQFTLRRTAYEIAFQNWSLDSKEHPRVILPPAGAAAGAVRQ
jgi:hypothetical protein